MFSVRLHFPILELIWSNKSIAIILTKQEQLRFVKIKPINDELFVTRWGWFRMRAERAVGIFKQRAFLYLAWNQKAIDLQALKELELFMIKTDRVQLEKWQYQEDEKLLSEVEKQSEMNLRFETEVIDGKVRVKTEKKINPETNEEYDAPVPIPHDKHMRILRALREPINTRVENWLSEYEKTDPSGISTGLKQVHNLKTLQKNMSGSITTKFPLIIILIVVLGVIGIATQGGNIIDHLSTGIHCMQTGVGCIGTPTK